MNGPQAAPRLPGGRQSAIRHRSSCWCRIVLLPALPAPCWHGAAAYPARSDAPWVRHRRANGLGLCAMSKGLAGHRAQAAPAAARGPEHKTSPWELPDLLRGCTTAPVSSTSPPGTPCLCWGSRELLGSPHPCPPPVSAGGHRVPRLPEPYSAALQAQLISVPQ